MTVTGFYITEGGSILQIDTPPEETFERERFDAQLEKGTIRPVDADAVEQRVVAMDYTRGPGGETIEVPTTQWFLIRPDDELVDELAAMKLADLRDYAATAGIDLGEARTKANVLAAIRSAEAEAALAGDD